MKRSRYHYDISPKDRDDDIIQWDLVPVHSSTYERESPVGSVIMSPDSRDRYTVMWSSSGRSVRLSRDCTEQSAMEVASVAIDKYRRTGRVV